MSLEARTAHARMPRGRSFLAGFLAAALLVGAAALGWALARPGPATETLHVVACQSTYGIPGGQRPQYPARITVSVPSPGSDFVDAYSDAYRILTPVLGPAGWRCSTNLGADGTYELAIYPSGRPNPLDASGRAQGDVEAIVADGSPVCTGCSDVIACPVFAAALSNAPGGCPVTSPSRELVTYRSGSYQATRGTAQVYDPAGVYGSLPQSGGANPARGVITYAASGVTSAGALSCVLPASESGLCGAIIDAYVAPPARLR